MMMEPDDFIAPILSELGTKLCRVKQGSGPLIIDAINFSNISDDIILSYYPRILISPVFDKFELITHFITRNLEPHLANDIPSNVKTEIDPLLSFTTVKDLIKKGVRDKAELLWLSNETALGDFGVRGVLAKYKGKLTTSEEFISAVFKDAGIKSQVQTAVKSVDAEKIYWENYEGEEGETDYDFAMLIPKFSGQPIDYIGKDGSDISSKVVNAGGFVIVDGIYDLDYDTLERNPDAWPSQYQNPTYPNIFAAGIAFAPPGPISRPHKTPNGTPITAAPPRTGMVSGIIGRVVALNIIDLIKDGRMTHSERMSEMVAACIASMGNSLWDGSAATIVVHPVVPDMRRYPNEGGRDLFTTHMEMGLSGAWLKRMLHDTFIWKLRALPGWKIIPE